MDITEADIDTLATKLADLQLTDGERAALDAVFDDPASDSEVEGFLKLGDTKQSPGYTEVEWTYVKRLRSANGFMKLGDIKGE